MKTLTRTVVVALIVVLAGSGASAQSAGGYDLHWNLPAAGGAAMNGAGYTLTGSVGQHDAIPAAMTSASCYALRGGFWPGAQQNDVIFRNGFEGC